VHIWPINLLQWNVARIDVHLFRVRILPSFLKDKFLKVAKSYLER
jgi:hypothetical protein